MPSATPHERATIPYLGGLFANRLPLATATESSRIADAVTAARLYAREYGTGISTIFTPKAEVTSGTWNYFSKT
ncbi:hypothetical protein GCM10020255_022830 [Rhodococcus baikonurensis]